MDNANGFIFDCARFKKHIMSYIDGELPVNLVSPFLAHADNCIFCKKELNELQFIRKSLSGMSRTNVTPDFSFRVINAIRNEQRFMQNPLYVVKLFLRENFQKVVFVPAAILILFGWITFYENQNSSITATLKNVVEEITHKDNSQYLDELGVERVNYILESVSPMDVEKGVIGEHPYIRDGKVLNPQLTLVNF